MRAITESELRQAFGDRTFARGRDYFTRGYVEPGVKKGNKLFGAVLGSAPEPYRVCVDLAEEIQSECSCPVHAMCKHGVALTLHWLNERSAFCDADELLASLANKEKSELLKIIERLIEHEPVLATTVTLAEPTREQRVNLDAMTRKVRQIIQGHRNYYTLSGVITELEHVKKSGDSLAAEGRLQEAVAVYLLLVEQGIAAFENGMDDSDGMLGELVIDCVHAFSTNAVELQEEQKRALIAPVAAILACGDYGLETNEMLYAVATQENVSSIEAELLRMLPADEDKFHGDVYRRRILDLLTHMYDNMGLHEAAVSVMLEAGLMNPEDYLRLAKALLARGKAQEAFAYVQAGLRVREGEKRDYALSELYFQLVNRFLDDRVATEQAVDLEVVKQEATSTALTLLVYRFDPATYKLIKRVCKKLGRYDELLAALRQHCKDAVILQVLVHDARIDDAIDLALASRFVDPSLLIAVAVAAKRNGAAAAARHLTLKAVRTGVFLTVNASLSDLIRYYVTSADEQELKDALRCIRTVSIAQVFADALVERSQEDAVNVLKQFAAAMSGEEIQRYARHLDRDYAVELCDAWVSQAVNRSHVHYDSAIEILRTIRDRVSEEAWNTYIRTFEEAHRGKRKLLEKLREARMA
jgi:tetratricopeptide (TPR) repeat protein